MLTLSIARRYPFGIGYYLKSCKCMKHKSRYIQEFSSRFIHKYATTALPKISQTEPSSKVESASSESSDTFGTLRKSLEKKKTKPAPRKIKDVKVITLKHSPKIHKSNESDVFGNLSDSNPIWYPEFNEEAAVDNDQSDDSTIVRNISRRYRDPDVYLENMKLLVAEKKLKEALALFLDMRRNYVMPHPGHYTFMIGACGKVGFTEMAFKLLRQMVNRGFKPTPATLTGLFNSCAESPFPEYGLRKASILKEKIVTKNWLVTQPTYHAMIKAFGRCGDIQTAFQIVDEMTKDDIKICAETYNFLLMSCISNKEAGCTHAIEVWRKMKERKCKPNLFSFNLLLRAVRDCDVGPEEVSSLLLQHWSSFSKRPYGFITKESFAKEKLLQLSSAGIEDLSAEANILGVDEKEDLGRIENSKDIKSENMSTSLEQHNAADTVIDKKITEVPSVLNVRPASCAEVLELGNIKTSQDRLALIGGAKGVLSDMKKVKLKPNIKTFTLLLETLPPNTESEEKLISLLDVYDVKPDMGFFNVLIKRRNFRHDHEAAKEVLLLVHKWSLTPDLITFGVLALGCRTYHQASHFINDMRKLGFAPNTEIVGALLTTACCVLDFEYLYNTLKLLQEENIEPNENMVKQVEDALAATRKNIIDLEHGKDVPGKYKRKGLSEKYEEFCKVYEQWLKDVKIEKPEHVWNQYRTNLFETSTETE